MDVTLTVVAPATGATADVRVAAPDTAPAPPLLDAIRAAVATDPAEPVTIGGRPVAADGTVADCALRDGMIVTVGMVDPPAAAGSVLVVVAGPDVGRRLVLDDGEHTVGRDPACGLALTDVTVSRRHLLVSVTSGVVTVNDLGSANGSVLYGHALVPGHRTLVAPDSRLSVGDTQLRLDATTADSTDSTSERSVVSRAPRLHPARPAVEVAFPPAPAPMPPTRVPVLAAVAPLVAGVGLTLVLRQWQFLAFTALSPVMILAQAASDRRASRRARRQADRDHAAATAFAQRRLDAALASERAHAHVVAPDLAALTAAARTSAPPLWQRAADDPDALVLRLGRGDLDSDVRTVGGPAPKATVRDVPVTVAMTEAGVLGVVGDRAQATALTRSLVIQAATLHAPDQLRLVVLAPGCADDWTWTRWLPHLTPRAGEGCVALVGFDHAQLAARVEELTRAAPEERDRRIRTLVVVDALTLGQVPAALTDLCDLAGDELCLIWCAADDHAVPATAGAVAMFDGAAGTSRLRLTQRGRAAPVAVDAELLARDVAESTARALAPRRDGGASSCAMPTMLRWAEVAGVDLHDPRAAVRDLTRRWVRGLDTTVPLGHDGHEITAIDLRRDGPHMLVAGTTGSGKSELLLAVVAGLVASNRPDDLSLLLVDHKGGAAFGPCARLPHAVGVVTDLDHESTQRALLSLTAELRRREALLAAAAAVDLDSYLAGGDASGEPVDRLARLVIIVDEFATLAEQHQEFINGLVGIAQRGRSLGVHLILATQRPEGVVSAEIRANTRLRICLGVTREGESRDVIDSPAAALISRTTPGRAYLRIGPGDLRGFQTARVGGAAPGRSAGQVTPSPAEMLGDPPSRPPGDSQPSGADLETLVSAAHEVTVEMGCRPPPPTWLPPLPARVPLRTPAAAGAGSDGLTAVWGLMDLPAIGEQRPLGLDLSVGGTTVIAGASRSGRTTAARAIALSATARCGPDRLSLWAIDVGGSLGDLAGLPHCGAVVPLHDTERTERLLAHLVDETTRRRRCPTEDCPTLMLVVDSWDAARAADGDGNRWYDTVLRLAVDGPASRLHTVITTDRSGLVGRLGGAATDKFALRLPDPTDFALVGIAARDVPAGMPPGRGFRAAERTLVQVALPDDADVAAAKSWPAPAVRPRRFDPLPRRVSLTALRDHAALREPNALRDPATGLEYLALGVTTDDLTPLTLARAELGSSFLVAGPPGSGRSTALALLAHQLSGRRLVVSSEQRLRSLDRPDAVMLPRDDQQHAADILDALHRDAGPPPDILVDDVDLLGDGPLWSRLEELIRHPAVEDRVIAMSGALDSMTIAFRGPIAAARRGRVGVLLCPSGPHDGDLFGIRLPRDRSREHRPGRGWLACRGSATQLQLADPDAPAPAGTSAQPSTD